MSQQIINVGSAPNDGTGDLLRGSQIKANANFTELYNVARIESVVAGTNVTVDNTDPKNPIVSASGGGGATERLLIKVKYLTGIRLYSLNTWRSYSQTFAEDVLLENGTGSEPDSTFFIQAESIAIPDGYIVESVQIHVPYKLNGSSNANLEVYVVRSEVVDSYIGNDSFNRLVICQQTLTMSAGSNNQKYVKNLTVNTNSLPTLAKSFLQIAIRDTTVADIRYNVNFNIILKKV